MSRPKSLPGQVATSPVPITDAELAQVFDRVSITGALTASIRQVIGPDRPTGSVLNKIASDPLLLRRRDEAMAHHAEKILEEMRRRGIDGVEHAVRYQGEVVGYEREWSDKLLESYARYHVKDYLDKRSAQDLRVQQIDGPDAADLFLAITWQAFEEMPRDVRLSLRVAGEWIAARRAKLVGEVVPERIPVTAEIEIDDPYDMAELAEVNR